MKTIKNNLNTFNLLFLILFLSGCILSILVIVGVFESTIEAIYVCFGTSFFVNIISRILEGQLEIMKKLKEKQNK